MNVFTRSKDDYGDRFFVLIVSVYTIFSRRTSEDKRHSMNGLNSAIYQIYSFLFTQSITQYIDGCCIVCSLD